jgi:hypothetical protein
MLLGNWMYRLNHERRLQGNLAESDSARWGAIKAGGVTAKSENDGETRRNEGAKTAKKSEVCTFVILAQAGRPGFLREVLEHK